MRNEIYSVFSHSKSESATNFRVQKTDLDFNDTGQYIVTIVKHAAGEFMTCECVAGSRETCRHRKMVTLFRERKLVDSRQYYAFDKERWIDRPKGDQDENSLVR